MSGRSIGPRRGTSARKPSPCSNAWRPCRPLAGETEVKIAIAELMSYLGYVACRKTWGQGNLGHRGHADPWASEPLVAQRVPCR